MAHEHGSDSREELGTRTEVFRPEEARACVAGFLHEHPEQDVLNVQLIASELVGNALRHGLGMTPDQFANEEEPPHKVALWLGYSNDSGQWYVTVAVYDNNPAMPGRDSAPESDPDLDQENGRGLALIEGVGGTVEFQKKVTDSGKRVVVRYPIAYDPRTGRR